MYCMYVGKNRIFEVGIFLSWEVFTLNLSQKVRWLAYLCHWNPNSGIKHNSKGPNHTKTDVQPFLLEMSFVPNGMNNLQISGK